MQPPELGFLIVGIALTMSIIMQVLQNVLVDVDKRESYMRELTKWRKKAMLARKTGDPKLLAEVQKDYSRIQLIQQELSKETMKGLMGSLFVIVIFLILIQWIGRTTVVIIAPFDLPLGFLGTRYTINGETLLGFNIIWWYFIAALPFASLLNTFLRMRIAKKNLRRILMRRVKKKRKLKK